MSTVIPKPVRLGLVGFGVGGNYFHAPFIEAAPQLELAGVVTRSPSRREELSHRFPGVPAYDSLADLVEAERAGDGLDAVTITTPPQTRRQLVLEALDHGLHVVADKPFAPDAEGAHQLDAAAKAAGRLLAVYHNRRWDSDIATLRTLLQSGRLGNATRFHSTMDQDSPGTLEEGPGGGLLRDLGSHLIDQALWLFGPAQTVFATLDWVGADGARSDVGFLVTLHHRSGVSSVLTASKRNHLDGRSLRVYGDLGSYLADTTDVQAQALFRGERPVTDRTGWGYEPRSAWGSLHTAHGTSVVPSEQGSYVTFYEQFADAILHGSPLPVTALDGVEVLRVLDAARTSDARGESVALDTSIH
ncbi:MAG TPA: Gfo/Idh/MocA family oxidoreductase [Microlunatus sp.]